MLKRILVLLALLVVVDTVTVPAFAVEGVAERRARKKIEAQKYPNQANEALQAKEFDRAIDLFTKAIDSGAFDDQPDTLGAIYFGRGNAYRQKGDCQAAIADYTKAATLTEKGDIYFSRAACHLELKQDDLALADLDARELGRRSLDLYLPSSRGQKAPLLIFVHGGFWMLSDDRYRIGAGVAEAQRGLVLRRCRGGPTGPTRSTASRRGRSPLARPRGSAPPGCFR